MAASDPKPFASLGPTLLARKGGARPAMRPQLASAPLAPQEFAQDLEDLGWNDMGEDDAERRETPVLSLTPAPHPQAEAVPEPEPAPLAPEPEVRRQQRAISQAVATASNEQRASRRPGPQPGRRAAFTLRLDAERHLKLRLASTVQNSSAQVLVTQALDRFLAEIPEIASLAAQLKRD